MTVVQNDVLRMDVISIFDGTDQQSQSFQYIKQDAVPRSDALTLTDAKLLIEALYLLIQAVVSTLVVFEKIRVFNKTQNLTLGDIAFTAVLAGTDVGQAMAAGASPVLNFNTAVPNVQLRKFGYTYTEVENGIDGRLGPTLLTAYALMGATMLAPQVVVSGTYQYGFLSPKTGGFVFPTSGLIDNIPGYQRRRKPGRGS